MVSSVHPEGSAGGQRRLSQMASQKLMMAGAAPSNQRRLTLADSLNAPSLRKSSKQIKSQTLSLVSGKGVSMRFSAKKYRSQFSSSVSTSESIGEEKVIPTSKAEYRGWYGIEWAQSPYFYSVLNFLPMMLTAQAKRAAADTAGFSFHNTYDGGANCTVPTLPLNGTVDALSLLSYANQSVSLSQVPDAQSADFFYKVNDTVYHPFVEGMNANCTWEPNERLLWGSFDYVSISSYCTTASVILQMIVFLSTGAMADFGSGRKVLLTFFHTLASLLTIAVYFFPEYEDWWINGMLFILSNLFLGASTVFYNAYLPMLTMADPQVLDMAEDENADADELGKLLELKSSRISTLGFIW